MHTFPSWDLLVLTFPKVGVLDFCITVLGTRVVDAHAVEASPEEGSGPAFQVLAGKLFRPGDPEPSTLLSKMGRPVLSQQNSVLKTF